MGDCEAVRTRSRRIRHNARLPQGNAKALALLERGASLSQVRDLLGQSPVEAIWSRYLADPPLDLREVFDRYSSSPEDLAIRLDSDET